MGVDTHIYRYKSKDAYDKYIHAKDAWQMCCDALWDKYESQLDDQHTKFAHWEATRSDNSPNPYDYDCTMFATDDEKAEYHRLEVEADSAKKDAWKEEVESLYSGREHWFNQWGYSRHPEVLGEPVDGERRCERNEYLITYADIIDLLTKLKKVIDECPVVEATANIYGETISKLDKEFVNKVFPVHIDWAYSSRHTFYLHTFQHYYNEFSKALYKSPAGCVFAIYET